MLDRLGPERALKFNLLDKAWSKAVILVSTRYIPRQPTLGSPGLVRCVASCTRRLTHGPVEAAEKTQESFAATRGVGGDGNGE